MNKVTLDLDPGFERGLEQMAKALEPKQYDKAVFSGLKAAASRTPVELSQQINKRYNLKKSRIRESTRGPFVSRTQGKAIVLMSNKPPSALQYGGTDNGRGLSMRVFRGKGGKRRVERGFIIKHGKLKGRPFRRLSDDRKSKIKFVSGPSVGRIVGGKGEFSGHIQAELRRMFAERFAKGIERRLKAFSRGF
jgi:hypothetical protein